MTLASVILLRHGETEWNAGARLQGHRDIALNATGRGQAVAAAPSIAALRPDVILSSDLQRARDTAEAVSTVSVGVPVGTDPRLRETSLGIWEGLTLADVSSGWPQEWAAWRSTSAHARPPGGESRWEVAGRAVAVVDDLDGTAHERALLVAHGGTIAGLTGRLLALPENHWSTLVGVGNCHWVVLHRAPSGSWRLHSYNAGLGAVVLPGGEDTDEVAGV